MEITFESIRENPMIRTYIQEADKTLKTIGYTEHCFPHVERVAHTASMLLEKMGYDARTVELAKIAGFLHDIGNVINRDDHAQSGAVMAFRILDTLKMPTEEICQIISAIGNHDEKTAQPVNPIAAALILADKSDVRRNRVRNQDFSTFDIHDRVNYAVTHSALHMNDDLSQIILELMIDTDISSVLEYFEIFMDRMLLCRRSAEFFGKRFRIYVNNSNML